jgi:prepilin-type N-terminal cleavage/methylation domain-containing protein
MTGNKIKKINSRIQSGFSLIELMVSVTLFSVVIISTTQIFKMVVDAQRGAIAAQNVEESLKYFSEITGKEMRMALKNSDNHCSSLPTANTYYSGSDSSGNNILYFQNRYSECVVYKLEKDSEGNQRFWIQRDERGGFVTPAKVSIDSLSFLADDPSSRQPSVVIKLKAHSTDRVKFPSEMTIQTTISSRYYK